MNRQEERMLMGNEAIGRGIFESGCTLVASYPGTPASEILSSVRAEFDHNLSQQLYLSNEAWEMVKNARANTMKITNLAADKIPAGTLRGCFSSK